MPPPDARLPVGIIGAGVVLPDSEPYRAAYEVAFGLARAGLVILCGGRFGVMEAACKGARDGGGISIGVLPTMDLDDANPFATILLPTDLGSLREPISRQPDISRNRVIASASRCLVAVGGGPGTANEIKHALLFGRTVFGICGAPAPEPAAPTDTRRLTARYIRLDSARVAVEHVLRFVE